MLLLLHISEFVFIVNLKRTVNENTVNDNVNTKK